MQIIKNILNEQVLFRQYNPQIDKDLIVKHLYTNLNNEKGLKTLSDQDSEYFIGSEDNFRLVVEIDNELIASLVLMREKIDSNIFNLYSVVTAESYRGTGLTKGLLDFTILWVTPNKYD